MFISLQHAQSTGSVSVTSGDVRTPPLIDPNYLSDRRDVDVFIEGPPISVTHAHTHVNTAGIRRAHTFLTRSPALAKFDVRYAGVALPECAQFAQDGAVDGWLTNEHLECMVSQRTHMRACTHTLHTIRHLASTVYHPTGTCRMGASIEQNSVVDERLRYVRNCHNG